MLLKTTETTKNYIYKLLLLQNPGVAEELRLEKTLEFICSKTPSQAGHLESQTQDHTRQLLYISMDGDFPVSLSNFSGSIDQWHLW